MSDPGFFRTLPEKLSFGDIVEDVPWGVVQAPLRACQLNDSNRPDGRARVREVGLDGLRKGEEIHAAAKTGLAMILWSDCEIDKDENKGKPPNKWFTAIAPVLPIDGNFHAEHAVAVRAGDRRQFFSVPALAHKGEVKDYYVDLRYIWSVKRAILESRIASLSAVSCESLKLHIFRFLTRMQPVDQTVCPHCFQRIVVEFSTDADEDD